MTNELQQHNEVQEWQRLLFEQQINFCEWYKDIHEHTAAIKRSTFVLGLMTIPDNIDLIEFADEWIRIGCLSIKNHCLKIKSNE